MSPIRTLATTKRVLTQIRHDPRTVALLVVVPSLLLVLLRFVLSGNEQTFQTIGVPMTGLFPLITMFLVSSITMLRERTTGTLERLMTMPIAKIDLLAGYALAFGIMAAVQTAVVTAAGFWGLGLSTPHPAGAVVGLAIANSVLGMSLGLFTSALARTEFQAIQFMPAFIFPQLLLCGLLVQRDQMATLLYDISKVLPMTYAYEALAQVANPAPMQDLVQDVVIVAGFVVLALVAGALTLQRRTV